MIRKIIKIDQNKCNGCGLCAKACHEGAIEMINNKAVLTKENYCDGLGDCLPGCPTGAISFEMREAPAYDEAAVMASKLQKSQSCSCPSAQTKTLHPTESTYTEQIPSQLKQWPVQIKLVPIHASWFDNADILIAADCTAYAYGNFHQDFIRDHITLIGCPKLDEGDYTEKLTAIFTENSINSITLTRMMVPCCGEMERAVINAIQNSKKTIPYKIVTINADGKILKERKG